MRLPEGLPELLRKSSSTVPATKLELDAWGMDTLERWDWSLIADRMSKGVVGMGSALVGDLLLAALDRGAVVRPATPARSLIRDSDGRVAGVAIEADGSPETIGARRGVVLASGGFEWNAELVKRFLGRPMVAPGSPPANTGDGLAMSMAVGAGLGNMSEAWWDPMIQPTGDFYDGAPLYRPTSSLRALPGGIVVNARGRRFVNEAMNYNDMGKALATFDPVAYTYANQPCWLVVDERFRQSYSIATCTPDSPTPNWMTTAATLDELAQATGIDPAGLVRQVADYNEYAARGEDPGVPPGRVGVRHLPRGHPGQPAPQPAAARGRSLLRGAAAARLSRDQGRPGHRRDRPGPRRLGRPNSWPLRLRQRGGERVRRGLSGCGRDARRRDDLRLPGRPRAGWALIKVTTPARRDRYGRAMRPRAVRRRGESS